jgi:hypothetical protein
MDAPKLIEPGVKYHLYNTLSKCHDTRVGIYTWVFNIVVFASFALVTGATLYYCYKNRLSPEERYNKMMKDQAYILSKIRFYQNERMNMPLSSLTSLPVVQERPLDPLDPLTHF